MIKKHIKAAIPAPMKTAIKGRLYKAVAWMLNQLENLLGELITFHTRPMRAADVLTLGAAPGKSYKNFAIVMQGPIITKRDFTVETLKLYRKFFPDALRVLSTWEGEDERHLTVAKQTGAEIILNRKPPVFGPANINLQLTSAKAGVQFAATLGVEYVLKTRTDQRMYQSAALDVLSNLLKTFPPKGGMAQRGRIIGLGAYNFATKKKMFHLYDHLIFGFTPDVQKYFGADLVPQKPELEFLKQFYPNDPFTAEGYFYTEFLKKVGYNLDYTEGSYLRSLAEHCILIEPVLLDWYWYGKHRRFLEYQLSTPNYKSPRHHGFGDWLNLYQANIK